MSQSSPWKYFVVVGLALSGVASFATTYNSISGINNLDNCAQTEAYKNALQTKFLVTLILSILAIVIGIILMFLFRANAAGNRHSVITMGIILVGIVGIIYSLTLKFKNFGNSTLAVISWGTFIAFIILGILIEQSNQTAIILTGPVSNE